PILLVPRNELTQARSEIRARSPAQQLGRLSNVCPRRADVGLVRLGVFDSRLAPRELLDDMDRIDQQVRLVGAEVDDLVAERLDAGDRAARDVVDVREVAFLSA